MEQTRARPTNFALCTGRLGFRPGGLTGRPAQERNVARPGRNGRPFCRPPHTGFCILAGSEVQIHDELDRKIADDVASSAIDRLRPMRSRNVVSSRAALRAVILDAIHEAYEIGVLAAERRQLKGLTRLGGADRPAWMDIRLDSPEELAANKIGIRPVVLKSLLGAGFRCFGDLRWFQVWTCGNYATSGSRTLSSCVMSCDEWNKAAPDAGAAVPGSGIGAE